MSVCVCGVLCVLWCVFYVSMCVWLVSVCACVYMCGWYLCANEYAYVFVCMCL